jgi:hypothetical protein
MGESPLSPLSPISRPESRAPARGANAGRGVVFVYRATTACGILARSSGDSSPGGSLAEEILRLRLALVFIVGVFVLAGAGAAAYVSLRRPPVETPHLVEASVGDVRLALSSPFLFPAERAGGALPALKIAAFFPEFTPAGDFQDVTDSTDIDSRLARVVFLTLRPADPSLDPSDRTARLYERFLDETAWSHPGGLIARAFEDDSPFPGDELYFTAPEGRDFAARCRKPDAMRKTQNTCQAVFRLGALDVELRFSAELLSEWKRLRQGAEAIVTAARR